MRRVLALVLALCAALVMGTSAASAHSVVVSSTPEDASSVAEGPTEATVTFNEALQSEFASITVVGPDGNLWSEGDPRVTGSTVAVDVRPLGPVGTYTIAFRVTSADGHPVSGTRTFELTTAGPGTAGAAADGSAPSPASAETGTAVAQQPMEDDGGVPLWPFLVLAVMAFAGGLAFTLRKKS